MNQKQKTFIKILTIILFIFYSFKCIGQTGHVPDSAQYYRIEEAQFIKNDSIYNIDKEFIEQQSGILFKTMSDSTVLISLDNGGIDKVLLLGYSKRIKNPGFKLSKDDADFFLWTFKGHNDPEFLNAFVYIEYVDQSLEEKGEK